VQAEAELLTRDDAVLDGLSPDDETALPFVRLVAPAVSVLVSLVTLLPSHIRGAAREAAAMEKAKRAEPDVTPHASPLSPSFTCTAQGMLQLESTSVVWFSIEGGPCFP
jgi:hypothetical protein